MNVNNVLMNGTAARGHDVLPQLSRGFCRHYLSPGCPRGDSEMGKDKEGNQQCYILLDSGTSIAQDAAVGRAPKVDPTWSQDGSEHPGGTEEGALLLILAISYAPSYTSK